MFVCLLCYICCRKKEICRKLRVVTYVLTTLGPSAHVCVARNMFCYYGYCENILPFCHKNDAFLMEKEIELD
jgi:hypothetical protein